MNILDKDNYPGLPKWPAAFVTGQPVSPEQAKEIIFRTDSAISYPSMYMGGNDRKFQDRCVKEFGWALLFSEKAAIDAPGTGEFLASFRDVWATCDAWRREMGILGHHYVYNSWLSSAYIGGPAGWCSPEGKIHFEGHNYGKWPSVSEIEEDWQALVEAFPFLDLQCSLFSGEACESNISPVCTIVVKDVKVVVCEPDLDLHLVKPGRMVEDAVDLTSTVLRNLSSGSYSHERAWPEEWVKEFGIKSTAAMKKVYPFFFTEVEK